MSNDLDVKVTEIVLVVLLNEYEQLLQHFFLSKKPQNFTLPLLNAKKKSKGLRKECTVCIRYYKVLALKIASIYT